MANRKKEVYKPKPMTEGKRFIRIKVYKSCIVLLGVCIQFLLYECY